MRIGKAFEGLKYHGLLYQGAETFNFGDFQLHL